jgi:zinc transport system ATP-binding protein
VRPPVLELRDVTVHRGPDAVLDRISLQVDAGTIHALVGPNGGGKSTLLGVVLGLVDFTGDARLNFRAQARLGYVPQRFHGEQRLPLTVAELLALQRQRWPVCLGVTAAAKVRIAALLEEVGLAGFERKRLDELSGGERQRVLLANAIDPAPELLLLDEPSTGLDDASAQLLEAALVRLRAAGTAILLVSHDRAQVDRLADRVTRISRSAEVLKGAA